MTNGEKIREMQGEELAKELAGLILQVINVADFLATLTDEEMVSVTKVGWKGRKQHDNSRNFRSFT